MTRRHYCHVFTFENIDVIVNQYGIIFLQVFIFLVIAKKLWYLGELFSQFTKILGV